MMEGECTYTDEELLAIHAEAERLDQGWRVWGVRVAIGVALALTASVVTATGAIMSAVYGGGGAGYNVYDRIWFGGFVALLVFAGISFGLAIPRTVIRCQLWRLCRQHGVKDLPPFPPPQLGERFGRDQVLHASDGELHLTSPRLAGAEGVWRLVCFIIMLIMTFGCILSVFASSYGWLIALLGGPISLGGVMWTLMPLSTNWAIADDGQGRHLLIKSLRWFFHQAVEEVRPEEIISCVLLESELMLTFQEIRRLRLTEIGRGELARWKARRLVKAIGDRLGLPNLVLDDTNERRRHAETLDH